MNTTELIKLLQQLNIKTAFRQDTATNWEIANPILGSGEPGYVVDSKDGLFKIGDGKTAWNDLRYANLNENHINDVQPNGNYFVRRKESPSKVGEWIELKDFDNILRDVKEQGTYLRKNGEWVLSEESNKANRFNVPDYVPIKEVDKWITTIKLNYKEFEEEKNIRFITSGMIEGSFYIRYNKDSITLVENNIVKHTLYTQGSFAYVKGEIAGVLFEFDPKTKILTFNSQVLLASINEELKEVALIEGTKLLDLEDVYNSIVPDARITIEDLYSRPFGQEVDMKYLYVNEEGISEKVYGFKLFKTALNSDQNEVLSNIKNVIKVEGTYEIDGKTKYISCSDLTIQKDGNNLVLVKANNDLDISNIKLVILYTK